mmetsp:Transcript_32503/g.50396  ORF Transcript_32503/g.50396 Transcript_32503/m.50396 type:complete len:345 (+) Transcript_32503:3065-4099(+)
MMRHKQNQTYRGTDTTLMSLPAKKERVIEVSLSDGEKQEYGALEDKAKAFYLDFRKAHTHDLSCHYLKLSQTLTPMRVACSGGAYPLTNVECQDHQDIEDDEEDIQPKGKKNVEYSDFAFTCKFKVLLSELERIRDEDPTSKSLVFSQYGSTLNWLKEELPKNGFQFRTLSGDMSMKQRAKALHDFQSDPPTTIFLLSMRAGNCGINLTQANRIFLMEPGFNPALEYQAIGRVHRLGQKREVEIVRLIVKDSIETRIRSFLEHKYGGLSTDTQSDETTDQTPTIGPVGNQANEKPKAKIMALEFDILFGVGTAEVAKPTPKEDPLVKAHHDEDMPDAAVSGGII